MLLKGYGACVTGPLESFAKGFAATLAAQGYARLSIRNLLNVLAFISRWLETAKLGPQALRSEQVNAILRARRRAGYSRWLSLRGLAPILGYLRMVGASPALPRPRATWQVRLLDQYAEYLRADCGLASDTTASRLRTARAFLIHLGRVRSARGMRATVIRSFFASHVHGYSSPSAAVVATALRSFLRFMHVFGEIDSSLAYSVPSIAGWRLSRLPRGVSEQAVKQLLRGCDRRTTVGLRDYAILMLVTRLGLRRCEVARLTLQDIDWRAGELVIRGKNLSVARLPLPSDLGSALAAYAKRRGPSVERELFLSMRAPAGSLSAFAVGAVVQCTAKRLGLKGVSIHRLRHTVATQMLRNGSSLAEIAEVLRHKSVATTAIYAKVDRSALRELAQPWPGSAQ
jgi:site-specific recombinase XerD